MKEAVERYLLTSAPRYAATTQRIHRRQLSKLLAFCELAGYQKPGDISPLDLMNFETWIHRSSSLSSSTIFSVMWSARLFLIWAYEMGETVYEFESFKLPKVCSPLTPTPVPSVALMLKLLGLPDTGSALGLRDQVVLELLYVLGLRSCECVNLDLNNVDLDRAVLEVRGKGGHERSLPLSSGILGTLSRYLEHGRPALCVGGSALLVGTDGCSRLRGPFLAEVVRRYGRRLGLELRPHQLRHTCATHLLEAGMKVSLIAVLLGHRHLKSTGIYARVNRHELQREFRRCHPRALAELT